ncbi:MAG: DUF1772 domain-containing protein, partial [Mesorhizobium sp.]
VCLVLAVGAILGWNQPGSFWLLAGALIYLVGNLIVTMIFNVPLNNALAAVDPVSTNGAAVWTTYLKYWVMWNHVRTITATAALGCFIVAWR